MPKINAVKKFFNFIRSDLNLVSTRNSLENRPEYKMFIRTALAWGGSATPIVLPRVIIAAFYCILVLCVEKVFPFLSLQLEPFEYSGAALGLLLVLRVNAGIDRWWEARKIWGTIVNQSRNLALVGFGYAEKPGATVDEFLKWVAIWPYVMKQSLREQKDLLPVAKIIGEEWTSKIRQAQHMPFYVGFKITQLLKKLRSEGLDSFAFQRAETERSILIDAIGACERIKNTRMPLALAIITRRFIFLFLTLLPFALGAKLSWIAPFVVALVAYPMFSLDEIGAELQNPFSQSNLNHLPLDSICSTIALNVLSLTFENPGINSNIDAV